MFVEEPVKYYHTEQECMVQAKDKAKAMTDTMVEFGYYIDSEAHACQYVDNQKST